MGDTTQLPIPANWPFQQHVAPQMPPQMPPQMLPPNGPQLPGPADSSWGGLRAVHPPESHQTTESHIWQPQQLPQGPLPVQENFLPQYYPNITQKTRHVKAAGGGKISNHKKKNEAAAAKKEKEAASAKKKKEAAAAKNKKEAAAAKKKKEAAAAKKKKEAAAAKKKKEAAAAKKKTNVKK